MRRSLGTFAVLFIALIGVGSDCGREPVCDKGYSLICPPPVNRPALLQAKRYISEFDGSRARDIYMAVNEEYKTYHKGKNLCEATFGVVLADSQIIVEQLNGLVLRLLVGQIGPAPAYGKLAVGGVKGQYKPAGGNAYDYGVLIENVWTSFEKYLLEMGNYASAVTAIPNCTYTIGVGEPPEPELASGQKNPFRYVINLGDSKLPVAQIVFRGRMDGAEARALEAVARISVALFDYILAHDLSLTIDVAKLAYLLGVPVECLKDDILGCGMNMANGELASSPSNLLDAAFIFEENPGLLAKSLKDPPGCVDSPDGTDPVGGVACVPQSDRWARRMPRVHRELARGFFALRSFFQSLVARSVALQGSVASEKLFEEYFIVYKDQNRNAKIDQQDDFGINLKEVNLSCAYFIAKLNLTKAEADKCNQDFDNTQTLINQALTFLPQLFTPSESAIGELQLFFERMYGSTGGVDNPALTAERIPLNSFDAVIRDFFLGVIGSPTPNFMEFDVKAFFNNPKPVREFLPYWQKVTDSFTLTRFITDSDLYPAWDPVTMGTTWQTATEYTFGIPYRDLDPDWTKPIERPLFSGTFDGGINGTLSNLGVQADCLNGKNLFEVLTLNDKTTKVAANVFYFSLPDPTLNTMIYVNMDEWKLLYDNNGNGADQVIQPPWPSYDCRTDPSGFQPASNYTLTKGLWLYIDFLVDHFIAASFAQQILDLIGIQY